MECTQRLECTQTQDYSQHRTERECPEQIGFLGICGTKYPVKKGPNKIGRDPQTCNIVLNLNSISRQHAVINVLHRNEFMIMDLDSANKTKLPGKSLQPYVPVPLHNGDMIQFGDVFGIFRLLEEENDLPMTQAISIPDTPVQVRHMSKIGKTLVPESPDVSDKDDSFIMSSQPKGMQVTSANFVKPGKTISIQPIGSKKIDNIFWNSSKKSVSLKLDDSTTSLNSNDNNDEDTHDMKTQTIPKLDKSINRMETQAPTFNKTINDMETQAIPKSTKGIDEMETQAFVCTKPNQTIHDMDTQAFVCPNRNKTIHDMETLAITKYNKSINDMETQDFNPEANNNADPIHTADTQMPNNSIHLAETQLPGPSNLSSDKTSIHCANTQIPNIHSPSMHSLETQIPVDLPEVCKVDEQEDMRFDLYADKENDQSINNAETQLVRIDKEKINISEKEKSHMNISDDLLFDEVDNAFDNFESQVIPTDNVLLPSNHFKFQSNDLDLPTKNIKLPNDDVIDDEPEIPQSQILKPQSCKRNNRINSDESTDCEDLDILPTQKIPKIKAIEDEDTDCEDDMIELDVNKEIKSKVAQQIEIDTPPQVINIEDSPCKQNVDLEDMPTQVITIENVDKQKESKQNLVFEDLPTQVLQEDVPTKTNTLEFSEELISPFKIPSKFVYKAKRKDSFKTQKIQLTKPNNNNDDYYQDTQDIFDDLCTQVIPSTEQFPISPPANKTIPQPSNFTSPNIERNSTRNLISDQSPSIMDAEAKVDEFVTNLSSQDVRDVVGVNSEVAKPKKTGSDGSSEVAKPRKSGSGDSNIVAMPRKSGSGDSDVDKTPKKVLPFKFMEIDLPNSQEIKTSVSLANKTLVTESSSDSETENNSEQNTPIVFHKKKRKPKPDVKQDLIKKFNADALPTRVITRVRKPTTKVLENDSKKKGENILKSAFLTEHDDNVDGEIISENISRLKNKNDKSKGKDDDSGIEMQNNTTNKSEIKKEIADVVKRDRQKRNHNEGKPETSVKEPNKKRTNNRTKNTKIDESTSIQADTTLKTVENSSKPVETNNATDFPELSTKRSTRSTRAKKTTVEETEKEPQREKRKYTKKQTNPSPEKEVRRSRRQRTAKEEPKPVKSIQKDSTPKSILKDTTPKSILKNKSITTNDQSTVYNISTGSNPESPSLKRSADKSIPIEPVCKRTRCGNTSLRATPARTVKTQHVLFTAFPYEEVKVRLEKLGAVIVTDVMQSTMLLTQAIKRTFKFLCAVGLGKPIVGPNWVQACADTNIVVDPWLYIIKDETAEKRFNFSLEKTLRGSRNFLSGWNISATPSVLPNATEMKLIVECSGGVWQEGGSKWICVSCTADKLLWPALRRRGATLVSTEFILGGVLRQKLEIQANVLK